jgi:hypothetical protein
MKKANCKRLHFDQIIVDENLQQRLNHNWDVIREYAIAIEEGAVFPPLTVFYDKSINTYYLVDGFHRRKAALSVGIDSFDCQIMQGDFRSAMLYSFGVNADHGIRRTNLDKKNIVLTILKDPEWCNLSLREIAQLVKVSHTYVAKVKKEIESAHKINFTSPIEQDNYNPLLSKSQRVKLDLSSVVNAIKTENFDTTSSTKNDNTKVLDDIPSSVVPTYSIILEQSTVECLNQLKSRTQFSSLNQLIHYLVSKEVDCC